MIKPGQLGTAVGTRPPRRVMLQPQFDALLVGLQIDAGNVPRRRDPKNTKDPFAT
jgi:hypothetical protein